MFKFRAHFAPLLPSYNHVSKASMIKWHWYGEKIAQFSTTRRNFNDFIHLNLNLSNLLRLGQIVAILRFRATYVSYTKLDSPNKCARCDAPQCTESLSQAFLWLLANLSGFFLWSPAISFLRICCDSIQEIGLGHHWDLKAIFAALADDWRQSAVELASI